MQFMTHHADSLSYPILPTLPILAAAVLYLRGWLKLHLVSANVIPFWRGLSFLSGLLLVWLALGSPLAALDHQFLTAHMVQHLLLMTLGPGLLLLGDPVRVFLQVWPQRFAQQTMAPPAFRRPAVQHLGRFLANPIVCWLAAAATLIVWHLPAVFAHAMQSPGLHSVEQATFFVAGLLFWWPVIQPWPSVPLRSGWPILLYLFLATIPCDILSAYLTFCDTVVYPPFLNLSHASQLSVLRDQQLAGSLMWTCITIVYLVPAAILTIRLLEGPSNEVRRPVESPISLRHGSDSSRT